MVVSNAYGTVVVSLIDAGFPVLFTLLKVEIADREIPGLGPMRVSSAMAFSVCCKFSNDSVVTSTVAGVQIWSLHDGSLLRQLRPQPAIDQTYLALIPRRHQGGVQACTTKEGWVLITTRGQPKVECEVLTVAHPRSRLKSLPTSTNAGSSAADKSGAAGTEHAVQPEAMSASVSEDIYSTIRFGERV